MKHAPKALSDEAVQDLSSPLKGYLIRVVGDMATAEDLLQETLIRIDRGLSGFQGRSSLKTWAFSIATRVVADHFRRPQSRVTIVDIDESKELLDETASPDKELVVDEMNACVRQVIESLPEDYRVALVLHDLEGLTASEVAEICGCSLATAKIRIHRSRTRLKAALASQCEFYRDENDVFRCDRKPSS